MNEKLEKMFEKVYSSREKLSESSIQFIKGAKIEDQSHFVCTVYLEKRGSEYRIKCSTNGGSPQLFKFDSLYEADQEYIDLIDKWDNMGCKITEVGEPNPSMYGRGGTIRRGY